METNAVVNNLITLYREKKLAHAYLIETNNIVKCYEDVKKIVMGICCPSNFQDNCSECNLCHLIKENNLPSLITVEPDGKNIKKEAIENLKSSFSKIPVYTENNIYIIKSPEKMNDTAFNKMLKFLEEPEDNIIGFFITENKDNVANTIVSRCEILKINYKSNSDSDVLGVDEDTYNRYFELAQEYQNMLEKNDSSIVWYNNSVLAKELSNRTEITIFLKLLFNLYMENVKVNHEDREFVFKKVKIISKYLEQLNYNVNTSLLLDSLAIEMGELYGK
ncbi:MAG: hypothetical protein IJO63_01940 [Bacilli bacterium]|nr:hypothetical protein [Bacilli bacterium]